MKPKILDMTDEVPDDEIEEVVTDYDSRPVDLLRSNREEGHIYESIEDELEVVDLEEVEDLLDDALLDMMNDAKGG